MIRPATIGVSLGLLSIGLAGCDPVETEAAAAPMVREMTARVARSRGSAPMSAEGTRIQCELHRHVELIRTQIELFRVVNDRDPWPSGSRDPYSWAWYLQTDDPGFRPRAPRNPLALGAVATTVVAISTPGATGADVDLATAGWVWNTTDKRFFAAGCAE